MKRAILLPILLVAVVALGVSGAGCGYGVNNVYRDDIRTVYVEFFGNDTFRRGLEVPLTHAVHEQIRLRTPFHIAPRDRADSVLTGEILDADVGTAVKTEDDEILLQRTTVRVRFSWQDQLTGRQIVPPQVVVETGRANRAVGVQPFEDVAPQAELFELALQEAARRIVEKMEDSW